MAKKKKSVWIPLEDVPAPANPKYAARIPPDIETLLEWDRLAGVDFEEKRKRNPGRYLFSRLKRISPGLFDQKTGEASKGGYIGGRDLWKGYLFNFLYWESGKHESTIQVEMEEDLETGRLRPWREYR